MTQLSFIVNGEQKKIEIEPSEMLSDVLRKRLGLTGTKISCNELECGACTVLVNDLPVLSCNYPAIKANGKQVITIEGLATGATLHPLQEAFVKKGATQCGFCTPGQIMTTPPLPTYRQVPVVDGYPQPLFRMSHPYGALFPVVVARSRC